MSCSAPRKSGSQAVRSAPQPAYVGLMPRHGARAVSDVSVVHACLLYDGDEEFRAHAGRFLQEGLRRGDRLLCVGDRAIESARSASDFDQLLTRGALRLAQAEEVYRADPEAQLAYYDDATQQALTEGFAGLCVLADLAAVPPDTFDELVTWEMRADSYMASGSGMSALCAYPAHGFARSRLEDVVAVHPHGLGIGEEPDFRLHTGAGHLLVTGVVDHFSSDRLARLLERYPLADEEVTLDVSNLEFIDGRASVVLESWLRDTAATTTVRLEGASTMFRRVWEVLGFSRWLPAPALGVET